jgi:hypothetical protein
LALLHKLFATFFWPEIKDAKSAKRAARYALIPIAVGLLITPGVYVSARKTNEEEWVVVFAVVIALLGLGIYWMSRLAAIAALVVQLVNVTTAFRLRSITVGLLAVAVIALLYTINGIRGTFAYRRSMGRGTIGKRDGTPRDRGSH